MLEQLHTNQRLLVQELIQRGASFKIIDLDDELIEINFDGKKQFLLDRFSDVAPYHMVKVSADKHLAKQILRNNNINTPQGGVFTGQNVEQALAYAKDLFPVVIKPNWGSHGNHIQVNLKTAEQLEIAIWHFISNNGHDEPFIIEKFFPWKEYRLFVTQAGGFAVVHREPASVCGDGFYTIKELIERDNKKRIQQKQNSLTSICPIVLDKEVVKTLEEQNLDLNYIVPQALQVFLRFESNLAKGGRAIDMTDAINPSFKDLALKCLNSFKGMPCMGLDLLCKDITTAQSINDNNYVIIEANSNPGLAMHTYPSHGKSRNVASLLADVMFPQSIKA